MDDRELLTVSQAAEAVSATSQTIRNWIRAGQLDAVRIGNRFLIARAEVERLRGSARSAQGESNWEHEPGRPPEPLVRRADAARLPDDPAEGLLGT